MGEGLVKNGQSLVCFMWLRVEKKRAEFSVFYVFGVVAEYYPFLFVTKCRAIMQSRCNKK